MNLRELALRDGAWIFGERNGTAFSLEAPDGNVFRLTGIIDDIGLSTDADGVQTAGRTATASYQSRLVSDGSRVLTPREGWVLSFCDLHGLSRRYAVAYAAPDAVAGITRLYLSADLSAGGESVLAGSPCGTEDER